MKQIINMSRGDRITLNDLEQRVRSARSSNDYILINMTENKFIKIAFSRDMTYTVGHNIYNMEFFVKTNVMLKQYPKTVTNKIAAYLFEWCNRFNR